MPPHSSMIQLCFVQTSPLALGGRETFPSKKKKISILFSEPRLFIFIQHGMVSIKLRFVRNASLVIWS